MACKYKVLCIETGVIYNSIKDAAYAVGCKSSAGISACCRGNAKTSGGFHWKYILNDDLPGEIWKPAKILKYYTDEVIDLPKYIVSNFGRIRNISNGQILKGSIGADGYNRVDDMKIHRIVATTFLPNNDPLNKIEVNHIDEDKTNNQVDNLEWVTSKQNMNYGTRTKRSAENHYRAVKCITTGEYFASIKDACKKYNIKSTSSIGKCARGDDKYNYVGKLPDGTKLVWEYVEKE